MSISKHSACAQKNDQMYDLDGDIILNHYLAQQIIIIIVFVLRGRGWKLQKEKEIFKSSVLLHTNGVPATQTLCVQHVYGV